MNIQERIEDAYLNGGGLVLSADDVSELRDRLTEDVVTFTSSEGDRFEVELPEPSLGLKRSH